MITNKAAPFVTIHDIGNRHRAKDANWKELAVQILHERESETARADRAEKDAAIYREVALRFWSGYGTREEQGVYEVEAEAKQLREAGK